ncbi:DUF192 domain-containing protein [Sphingomonas sp.]|uniref:DUF192 domain-containing protein n=1 Tax=Sphingomonas sp. TaxID=28214 RepID=UPI001E0F2918|nr:DUF192 domain-containing protein [Sphingomonas sp.]MBX9795262.1 DUF192 domain-containing protein [Sphingomonas sp.]
MRGVFLAGLAVLCLSGCSAAGSGGATQQAPATADLTITSAAGGAHRFKVELARTTPEQARGLMFRTNIAPDGGMLFHPYPADGGPPREATFWMKDTPSPLDIIFIRADRTIARIAENTTPFSQDPIPSGEPVAAVLELRGGRTAELGIAEGDRVAWGKAGQP